MNPVNGCALLFVICLAIGFQISAASGADVLIGIEIPNHRRVALSEIDHDGWNQLLGRYVDDRGLVNYSAWQASQADLQALEEYLNQLSRSNGQGTRQEQLAFWINAYNAVTIKGILREYPTSSIRNHTAKFFGYNIWKNLKLIVGGKPISLDAIEHEVLRKMEDPRIHFAIVCASIGCPRLINEAYRAERLDEQLTMNAQHFFSDATKFRYDATRNMLYLSPILKWFAEDFGASRKEQLRRISVWIPDPKAARVAEAGDAKVRYLDYDWGLNDWK